LRHDMCIQRIQRKESGVNPDNFWWRGLMKYRILKLIGALLFFTTVSNFVHAQQLLIDTVLPEPIENPMCIDDDNDGFGWNGECTCIPEYKNFGRYIGSSGSTLAVMADSTPLGCEDQQSVTIYDIRDDGGLEKQTEIFVSNTGTGSSRFLETLSNGTRTPGFAVDDKYIVVNGEIPIPTQNTEVFERSDAGSWEKKPFTLDTWHLWEVVDDELLAYGPAAPVTASDRRGFNIRRYSLGSGELLQTIFTPDNSACPQTEQIITRFNATGNLIVVIYRCIQSGNNSEVVALYEKSSDGDYQLQFTNNYPNLPLVANIRRRRSINTYLGEDYLRLGVINTMSDFSPAPSTFTAEFVTYKKYSGVWTEYSDMALPGVSAFETPTTVRLSASGDQLIRHDTDVGETETYTFFNFDRNAGWSGQKLVIDSPFEAICCDTVTSRYARSGDRLTIVHSAPRQFESINRLNRELPADPSPIVTLFERDNEGQWNKLVEQIFTDGGSVPTMNVVANGNNSFVELSNGGFLNIRLIDTASGESNSSIGTSSAEDVSATDEQDGSSVDNSLPSSPADTNAGESMVAVDNQDGATLNGSSASVNTPQSGGGSICWPLVLLFLTVIRLRRQA